MSAEATAACRCYHLGPSYRAAGYHRATSLIENGPFEAAPRRSVRASDAV
jgi:hypothetical protein